MGDISQVINSKSQTFYSRSHSFNSLSLGNVAVSELSSGSVENSGKSVPVIHFVIPHFALNVYLNKKIKEWKKK